MYSIKSKNKKIESDLENGKILLIWELFLIIETYEYQNK